MFKKIKVFWAMFKLRRMAKNISQNLEGGNRERNI